MRNRFGCDPRSTVNEGCLIRQLFSFCIAAVLFQELPIKPERRGQRAGFQDFFGGFPFILRNCRLTFSAVAGHVPLDMSKNMLRLTARLAGRRRNAQLRQTVYGFFLRHASRGRVEFFQLNFFRFFVCLLDRDHIILLFLFCKEVIPMNLKDSIMFFAEKIL